MYNYHFGFQDYESDFQECTDSDTPSISEKSDSSDSHLEPIELQMRQKVLSERSLSLILFNTYSTHWYT